MATLSWEETKKRVRERAHYRCEYCLTCQINTGQAMHIEHINPHGGDQLENLCLSCPNCNLSKATAVTAPDPQTNQTVSLYNPRHYQWADHFAWATGNIEIQGITAIGRATVMRLKMNRLRIMLARERWVKGGFHPPT